MLISSSTSCTSPFAAAAPSIRRSSSTESTLWISETRPTTDLTLLRCRWPIKCKGAPSYAPRAAFSSISCTRFSPQASTPAAMASRTRSASLVLLAATSMTSEGSRPARSAAAAMFFFTSATFSAMVMVYPNLLSLSASPRGGKPWAPRRRADGGRPCGAASRPPLSRKPEAKSRPPPPPAAPAARAPPWRWRACRSSAACRPSRGSR